MKEWFKKKPKAVTSLCCLAESTKEFVFSVVTPGVSSTGMINEVSKQEKDDTKTRQSVLDNFVTSHYLQNQGFVYVLSPQQYRLFLVDKPNVPEDEIKNSVRWLVRDLVDYPLEEAVIDLFEVSSADQKPRLYVVVTRLPVLQEIVEVAERCQLKVQKIAIVELALLPILSQVSKEPLALLYAEEKALRLMISKAGAVGMVREVGDIELLKKEQSERLTLALQRSFEFYQAHIDAVRPTQLLLPMELHQQEGLAELLSKSLSMPVAPLSLPKGLVPGLEGQQALMMLAIAGESLLCKEIREGVAA